MLLNFSKDTNMLSLINNKSQNHANNKLTCVFFRKFKSSSDIRFLQLWLAHLSFQSKPFEPAKTRWTQVSSRIQMVDLQFKQVEVCEFLWLSSDVQWVLFCHNYRDIFQIIFNYSLIFIYFSINFINQNIFTLIKAGI